MKQFVAASLVMLALSIGDTRASVEFPHPHAAADTCEELDAYLAWASTAYLINMHEASMYYTFWITSTPDDVNRSTYEYEYQTSLASMMALGGEMDVAAAEKQRQGCR